MDPITNLPVFAQLQVRLACEQCIEDGKAGQCKHMLHLVPQWQSSARHERLKAVMSDRPDLIQSELAVLPSIPHALRSFLFFYYQCSDAATTRRQGVAFDSLQQCFRATDIDAVMTMRAPKIEWKQAVYIIVDPAAGGPQSDFALISITRFKGVVTVRHDAMYATLTDRSNSSIVTTSSTRKPGTSVSRRCTRKRHILCGLMRGSELLTEASSLRIQYLNFEWKLRSRKKRHLKSRGRSPCSSRPTTIGQAYSSATSRVTRSTMS